jgi:hypothetical protein
LSFCIVFDYNPDFGFEINKIIDFDVH